MNHLLHIEYLRSSTLGDCSCGRWDIESSGNDESARLEVRRAFERHESI